MKSSGILRASVVLLAAMIAAVLPESPLLAQAATSEAGLGGLGGFSSLPGFPGVGFPGGGGLSDENPIEVSGSFEVAEGTDRGRLHIDVELAPEWHIYSLTQKPGGPTKTTLKLSGSNSVELLGPFSADQQPKSTLSIVWAGVTVEEHSETFRWSAPIKFEDASAAKGISIEVVVNGLTCREGEGGGCIPYKQTITAEFSGTYELPKASGEFRNDKSVVLWRGEIVPAVVAPGGKASLKLTAIPDAGFHVYKSSIKDEASSTNFVVSGLGDLKAYAPVASDAPVTKEGVGGLESVTYHEGEVTWTIPIEVPAEAAEGERQISGMVQYQACTETSCRLPSGLKFNGTLLVSMSGITDRDEPLAFEKARSAEVLDAAAETKWVTPKPGANGDESQQSLVVILAFALIGGLILNFMPCVLPVVGLKLMALVDSAGDDHRKVLSHNLWYSLGLLSVFWCLALVAIYFRLRFGLTFSWGQQFTYFGFRLGLTLLVFVMALSFLGVWEIPLPGFASGKASQQLQKKEGPAGAFFKGVFTTVLATPCSGPFLGAVFGFSLAAPPAITFLVFSTVGLGMAMPYIIIGLVPQAVYLLPKPGAWMETLKQLMAFALLGTVAFLFSTFIDVHKLPVFVTLIGAWFGCWMIGSVPLWDKLQRRLTAWGGGLTAAILIGVLSFRLLVPGEEILAWQPYSEPKLAELKAEGKTVMIDFTASWCTNCHVNYNFAINTEETAALVEELGVVPMIADFSDSEDPEISNKLAELQAASIPLLAIYPGNDPNNPIILPSLISQGQVLEALKQAGPSVGVGKDSGPKVALLP